MFLFTCLVQSLWLDVSCCFSFLLLISGICFWLLFLLKFSLFLALFMYQLFFCYFENMNITFNAKNLPYIKLSIGRCSKVKMIGCFQIYVIFFMFWSKWLWSINTLAKRLSSWPHHYGSSSVLWNFEMCCQSVCNLYENRTPVWGGDRWLVKEEQNGSSLYVPSSRYAQDLVHVKGWNPKQEIK